MIEAATGGGALEVPGRLKRRLRVKGRLEADWAPRYCVGYAGGARIIGRKLCKLSAARARIIGRKPRWRSAT